MQTSHYEHMFIIGNFDVYTLLLTLSRRFILFWAGQKFWAHLLTSRVKMGGLLLHYSRYLGVLGLEISPVTTPTPGWRPKKLTMGIPTDTDKNSLFGRTSIGKMGLCIKGKGPATYGGSYLSY